MGVYRICFFFFFQAEDGIRDWSVTGVQTCALPIFPLLADDTQYVLHNPPDLYAARFAATEQGELGEMLGAAHRTKEACAALALARSEERRVGKEGRSRWAPQQ